MKALLLFLLMAISSSAYAQGPDCVSCPPPRPFLDIIDANIYHPFLHVLTKLPPWSFKIEHPVLDPNPLATKCVRNMNVVDTIVIHHSSTKSTTTPKDLNTSHQTNGSIKSKDGAEVGDPWLMVGYHYLINASYVEEVPQRAPVVSKGRPLDIAGSHAGKHGYLTSPPDSPTLRNIKSPGSVLCGKEGGTFVAPDDKTRGNAMKANYSSIGIAFMGTYAPKHKDDAPQGYPSVTSDKRELKTHTLSKESIDIAAKLACRIQKAFPSVKKIIGHKDVENKETNCPGSIENHLEAIKLKAEGYGCKFN